MADLEKLKGIDAESVEKIKQAGIDTVEAFYEAAKYPDSRQELSGKTGIDTFTLEGWSSAAGNFLLMADMEW